MANPDRGTSPAAWLLLAAALAGLITAAVDTFNAGNGIAFTPGTYLVLASTAVLLALALIRAFATAGRGLRVTLAVVLLLDLLGSALAAYLLEAYVLVGCMAVGLIAWILLLFAPAPGARATRRNIGHAW